MRTVRIYKDDIRIHILRSLFFTDSVIAVSGAVVIAGLLFIVFHNIFHFFEWSYYLSALILTEIFFIGLITQKIDNQPIYKIVPRGITFKSTKKEYRQKELDPYFVDFSLQDNLIIKKSAIIKMHEIDPFDIALLNDQDREHFFIKLKHMIHMLPSQLQLIVRKEKATIEDYSKHFFTLYDQSNAKRESLIDRYISDMTKLIQQNSFTTTHHYAVFSVSCDTSNPYEKIKSIKKINDITARFSSSLVACNIAVRPLKTDELITFANNTLR